METHRFVTTILNRYLMKFKDVFKDIKYVNSIWIGGIEYTTRKRTILNYAIFDDWRKELFNLMGKELNINKFYHHLRQLYRIVGTLTIKYPKTYKKANSIMWKLLSEVDIKLKLHRKKKEMSYFKQTLRRIKKVRIKVQPEPEEGEIITPNPVKNPPKSPFVIKIKKIHLILMILIILTILIFWLAFSNVIEQVTEKKLAVKTEYYNETLSNEISFKEYLENIYKIEGEKIQLKGFLKRYIEGTEMAGIYVQSITDDYDNNIDLINMNYNYIKFFPKKGTTQEVYQIEGTFKRRYKTLLLEPTKIELSERGPSGVVLKERRVEYTKEIIKNITKPKSPFIRSFVFSLMGKEVICSDGTKLNACSMDKPYFCSMSGLVRNPTKCNCPKGERLYKKDCIEKIECGDGTLEPDCSKNKPKQCVDGKLIDNANLCGCLEDYKIVQNGCVKIQRCSDGTIYGECSYKKPLYCNNGRLIEKASKCTCPIRFYEDGEVCIVFEKVVEKKIWIHCNLKRKEEGLAELEWDSELANIARTHSNDMVTNNYFEHINLKGEDPTDRAKRMGFHRTKQLGDGWYTDGIAENIGKMSFGNIQDIGYVNNNPESIAVAQVKSFMDSPGHRANILNEQYTHLGVGVAHNNGEYTTTQNFW